MSTTHKRFNHFSMIVITTGVLAGLAFGFSNGIFAGVLLFLKSAFHVTSVQKELLNTANLAGAAVGSLLLAPIADRLGRRVSLWSAAGVGVIGAIGGGLAGSVTVLAMFRFSSGLALGMLAIAAPLLIAEMIPARIRGAAITTFQLGIVAGITLGGWVDFGLAAGKLWRLMLMLGALPPVLLSLWLTALPDTPRWYAMRGRSERSRQVLARLFPGDPSLVEAELAMVLGGVEGPLQLLSDDTDGSSPDASVVRADPVLRHRGLRLAFYFGLAINVFDALVGIQVLNYYLPTILVSAGFTTGHALLWTAGIGIGTFVSTIIGLTVIDRWGRRPMMITALGGMTVGMLSLATLFYASPHGIGLLGVAAVAVFQLAFSFGWGMMSYVYLPEIFQTNHRAKSFSAGKVLHWALVILVVSSFLTVIKAIGGGATFYVAGGVNLTALIVIAALAPETRGKELEEVEALWIRKATRLFGRHIAPPVKVGSGTNA